jgi:iron complex transport system substrate-binding protein
MSQYIRNCLLVILSLVLLSAAGCNVPSSGKAKSLIEITDQLGRVVTLVRIPERIVSIAPSNTEVLFALGLADRTVGVTEYCNYPPEAKEKSRIGGFSTPNIEKLVAVSTDLVLATSMHQKTVIPRLEEMGIPVFALDPKTLDEILESISLVGRVTGREKDASGIVAGMRTKIKSVTDKTGNLLQTQKPRVLYITWFNPLMAAGLGTLQDELIEKAGGVNIAHSLIGHANISLEAVVATNPEVIIAGVGMGTGGDAPLQFARTEPRLINTDARQHNRVYAIDVDLAGRSGPRITDALEQFAKFIHPEFFKAARN